MRDLRTSFLLIGILVSTAGAAEPAPVDLSRLAGWDIVIAEDASPSEQYAAEEFRDIFKTAGGHDLPINKSPARPEQHIFIGASKPKQASPVAFAVEQMGPEDFRIVVRDQWIAIAGGRPRGTLYGVYTFLEDYVGVRFLTVDHTHVPKLAASTPTGPVDRSFRPRLSFRWSYYGENMRDPAFAARIRVNTVSDDPRLGGKTGQNLINHTFGVQIPTAKYGAEHPEYFALRDGKRLKSGDDWFSTQPCLTNPDVLKIVTEAVLKELKEHPGRENVSVSQNDNTAFCQCPNCKAIDEREESNMGTLLTFINAVAEAVEKEYPRVKVGTLSYQHTRKPPKFLKPRANVQIQLCSIECCDVHPINDPACKKNAQFCSDLAEWAKITENVYIWNYNTNFSNYLLPFANLRVIEPNIKYFVEKGAKGIFMQAAGNTTSAELSDLRNYVIANLLWDPTREAGKLIDEFLNLHYGKAAPPIRAFINQYHDQVATRGIHPNCYGDAAAHAIDDRIAQAALSAFDQAMTLADDDAVRKRVAKASICAYRAALEPAFVRMDGQPLDEATAARLRPIAKRFAELCDQFKVPMFSEGTSMPDALKHLRKKFAMKDTDTF